jgi:hypothetical protein
MTDRFTWTGWESGSDVSPKEPGKEWLAILDEGEEYAVIVLRTDAAVFDNDEGALNAARATRELRAQNIVRALNAAHEKGEVVP